MQRKRLARRKKAQGLIAQAPRIGDYFILLH